jgi:N-acyl-D-amino-acid deacylase
LVDRGYLAPGMAADVAVFDPATVIDRATYEDAGQLSEGIREVLVNGRPALRAGKVTGEQGGRMLTRTSHMPSRAMTTGVRALRIDGRSQPGDVRVRIDIGQRPSEPRAKGTFRLATNAETLEAAELGVLQIADKWASFTARVRAQPSPPVSVGGLSSREERSTIVIVEFADPFVDGRPRTVTIVVDGQPLVTGVLQ